MRHALHDDLTVPVPGRPRFEPRHLGGIAAAALLGLGTLGGTLWLAPPASAATQTLHFYSVSESMTLENAQGQPLGPNDAPVPGDIFDQTNRDYVGNNKHHAKNWTATDHLRCTFTSVNGNNGTSSCNGEFASGNSLLLANDVTLTFRDNSTATVQINGGTGKYKGARGGVVSTPIGNSNNSNTTITLSQT